MRRFAVMVVLLASCGSTTSATVTETTTTTTTPPVGAPVAIDDSRIKDRGIDGQWIMTTDPDGTEHLCFVVSEQRSDSHGSGLGLGVGLGVSCHERGPR